MNYELRELAFGETLGKGFTMYLDNFVQLMLISLACNIPIFLLLLFRNSNSYPGLMVYILLYLILIILGGVISTGISVDLISKRYLGKKSTVSECFKKIRSKILTLIGLILVIGLFLFLALMGCAFIMGIFISFLITGNRGNPQSFASTSMPFLLAISFIAYIPTFLLWIRMSLSSQVLIIEDKKIMESIKRSRELTKGFLLRIFIFYVILYAIQYLVSFAGSYIAGAAANLTNLLNISVVSRVFSAIITWIFISLTSPFSYCVMILIYFNLRIKKEGFAIEYLADQFSLANEDVKEEES